MHFCSSPKVDSIKQENSRDILYLQLAIYREIMGKIRDKESQGNNDMICHARVSRYNLLRDSTAQSLLHRWEAILLWSIDNSQNGKISFFMSCIGGLEMNLALHKDLLFPWRIQSLIRVCLSWWRFLFSIPVKCYIPWSLKCSVLGKSPSLSILSISEKSKKNHEFFLSFSREKHFASIHSIPLRYYYVIAKFDNAL